MSAVNTQHTVTVPTLLNQDVANIIKLHNLTGMPAPVPYQNINNYPDQQCHISAKHAVKYLTQSGRRVHGWAFWNFTDSSGSIVLAEFHSVVRDAAGNLIDVTPTRAGVPQVLFLEDNSLSITAMPSGDIVFRSELSPFAETPHLYQWEKALSTFTLPQSVVQPFCAQVGIQITDILTDPTYG